MRDQRGGEKQTRTFRAHSMQAAVADLKNTLGPDAVIVNTRRGNDRLGPYVEITAAGSPMAPPTPQPSAGPIAETVEQQPAMGGRRGATAAYARTAVSTQPAPSSAQPKTLSEQLRGSNSPFAERAAWLAKQIEARQQEGGAVGQQIQKALSGSGGGLPPELLALRDGAVTPPSQRAPGGAQLPPQMPAYANNPSHSHAAYANASAQPQAPVYANTPAQPQPVVGALDTYELEALRSEVRDLKAAIAHMGRERNESNQSGEEQSDEAWNLRTELAEIRQLLRAQPQTETEATDGLLDRVLESGIHRIHAQELLERVNKAVPGGSWVDGDVLETFTGVLSEELNCRRLSLTRSGQRKVVGFVGPTGVGKTTTIAKIATKGIRAGLKVALVAVDNLRLAGMDRLARYAESLDVPLTRVGNAAELASALDKYDDFDLVLVDTDGRNPRVPSDLRSLENLFRPGWGGKLVLTLACSTRQADLFNAIDAFAPLRIEGLCITKTDETDALGTIYSCSRRASRPVVWTTDGQRVPEDIADANAPRIARSIASVVSRLGAVARAS